MSLWSLHCIRAGILSVIFLTAFQGRAFTSPAGAESAAPAREEKVKLLDVAGEVSNRTRYNLSIEFTQNGTAAEEMILPFDEKTRLQGYLSLSDIKRTDIINAKYKRTYYVNEDGKEIYTGTMATEITLVKSGAGNSYRSKEYSY